MQYIDIALFSMEHHLPQGMIGLHPVVFLKGHEDMVLSAGLGTTSEHGAYPVVDLTLAAAKEWGASMGFYVVNF